MERVAVFVDAGYLFARGCELLGHGGTPRHHTSLNLSAFTQALLSFLAGKVQSPLLRVYWYDGLPPSGNMSSDQSNIALSDNFKLRLGQINGFGQQKGVDSMIITDMIELARNKGITDAVLIGGDDDLRIGVQVTQTFGVRVHVLGFGSDPRHASVNKFLRQEADTSSTWDQTAISSFITIIPSVSSTTPASGAAVNPASPSVSSAINSAVDTFVASLDSTQLSNIAQHRSISGNRSIPSDVDRELLRAISTALGAPLDQQQKRDMRRHFNAQVTPKLPTI